MSRKNPKACDNSPTILYNWYDSINALFAAFVRLLLDDLYIGI